MSKVEVQIDDQVFQVEVKSPFGKLSAQIEVVVDGKASILTLPDWQSSAEAWHWFEIDGSSYEIDLDPELRWIKSIDGLHRIEVSDLEANISRPRSGDSRIKAPIPGLVSKLFVQQDQEVKTGERLLILEAMKMENEICSPKDGRVKNLNVFVGKSVALAEVMASIE